MYFNSFKFYFLAGHSDIALYGPFYVTAADVDDGPTRAADESPFSGQRRNSENILIFIIAIQAITNRRLNWIDCEQAET